MDSRPAPEVSGTESRYAVSRINVPDSRRTPWLLRHPLAHPVLARLQTGRREPAWDSELTPRGVRPVGARNNILCRHVSSVPFPRSARRWRTPTHVGYLRLETEVRHTEGLTDPTSVDKKPLLLITQIGSR
jgi:hypothetical protein